MFDDNLTEEPGISANSTVQVGECNLTEAGIVEMNKQQFNEVLQGMSEIQSILLRDTRRRGLTRKAVQKCRQRQNIRLSELEARKAYLQKRIQYTRRVHERTKHELGVACATYERIQNIVMDFLHKNPFLSHQIQK